MKIRYEEGWGGLERLCVGLRDHEILRVKR